MLTDKEFNTFLVALQVTFLIEKCTAVTLLFQLLSSQKTWQPGREHASLLRNEETIELEHEHKQHNN